MSADPARDHPVVVCAHGADTSGAVQLGALLAAATRQRLVLASAYAYEPVALGAAPLPSPLNEVRYQAAASQAERAARLVPRGVEVEQRTVPAGRIPDALADLARELDACALVLGRDLEGGVTRAVLAQAPCPVAVSPFTVALPQPEPLATIGVAYDGSPAARCALAAAAALAGATGARVRVLAVGHVDGAGRAEDDAAHAARQRGAVVDVERPEGSPGPRLVAASDELDLLVCGSRGRGRVAAAMLGSVSGQLVRAARCPVLVVPPGVRRRHVEPLGLTTAA